MSIQDFMDSMEDSCGPHGILESREFESLGTAHFGWSAKGIGFGTFYFYEKADEDGEIRLYCENEMMSKEFIKKMLCHMVDNAIMNDPNPKDEENDKS